MLILTPIAKMFRRKNVHKIRLYLIIIRILLAINHRLLSPKKNDNASYTENNELVENCTVSQQNIFEKFQTKNDDDRVQETQNSFIVNSLNWEVEHYISCKKMKLTM